ncbi:MAG TPA: hypothetical protein VFN21_00365, partial [Acidimicrobiales bacterium]|nr:hypothetical protein [Acidimicrobiales bacterium]
MNDEIIDDRIRSRLQEITSHDVPDVAAPRASGDGRRRGLTAALVVAACLIVIAGLALVVRNDREGQVVNSLGPLPTTTDAPTASVTTVKGLANFPLEARNNVAFVAVPDGFIVWGGGRETRYLGLTQAEPDGEEYADGARYRASTDTWTIIPPAPVTVDVRLVGGKPSFGVWSASSLYVARGDEAARWDPSTNAWHRLPELAADVQGLAAVNGEVLAIGPDVVLTAPDARSWTALPTRPPIGDHLGLQVLVGDGVVYVVPYQKMYGDRSPIVAYSPRSRTWRDLPAPPIDTGTLDAGWDGSGLIIVNFTTLDASTDRPRTARQAARYDPTTDTWTKLDDLPEPL